MMAEPMSAPKRRLCGTGRNTLRTVFHALSHVFFHNVLSTWGWGGGKARHAHAAVVVGVAVRPKIVQRDAHVYAYVLVGARGAVRWSP